MAGRPTDGDEQMREAATREGAALSAFFGRQSDGRSAPDPAATVARIKLDYRSLGEKDRAAVSDWFSLGCKEDA
jgi:hypothetical protein